MTEWIDIAHVNAALLLGGLGMISHWFIKVNRSFRNIEHLRFEILARLAAVEALFSEHEAVSEQVHVDIARRLERLEGWPTSRNEPRH